MESRWKPSVTVAAIIERDGRYLLVEEETPEGLCLNNPAGHLDPGESLLQGVVREALEETACVFTPEALVGVYLSRFQRPGPIEPPSLRPGRFAAPQRGTAGVGAARPPAGEDVTYLRFAICGSASEPEPGRALDHGIVRTLWLTPDEIRASRARHRSPLVLRCVEDHLAGKRYPLAALVTDPTLFEPEIKGASRG